MRYRRKRRRSRRRRGKSRRRGAKTLKTRYSRRVGHRM